jgi:hypothetical protein
MRWAALGHFARARVCSPSSSGETRAFRVLRGGVLRVRKRETPHLVGCAVAHHLPNARLGLPHRVTSPLRTHKTPLWRANVEHRHVGHSTQHLQSPRNTQRCDDDGTATCSVVHSLARRTILAARPSARDVRAALVAISCCDEEDSNLHGVAALGRPCSTRTVVQCSTTCRV